MSSSMRPVPGLPTQSVNVPPRCSVGLCQSVSSSPSLSIMNGGGNGEIRTQEMSSYLVLENPGNEVEIGNPNSG